MTIIAEVRFAHERGALADTLQTLPDVDSVVIREASTDPAQQFYLLRFENAPIDAVTSALERDRTVERVRPIPGFESQHVFAIEFVDDAKLLNPQVTEHGGYVLEARSSATIGGDQTDTGSLRGWQERWLLPGGDELRSVWTYAREEAFEFEILSLQQDAGIPEDPSLPDPETLTEHQREALCVAYDMGYFAEPREASLDDVADRLGISATAAGGRLKRGMKSLIGTALAVETDRS